MSHSPGCWVKFLLPKSTLLSCSLTAIKPSAFFEKRFQKKPFWIDVAVHYYPLIVNVYIMFALHTHNIARIVLPHKYQMYATILTLIIVMFHNNIF
jgi:hypothetical protein